ncbi:hypothetical protein AK830_g4413 [Neonectria ditissima]|uniref:WW domain-containing oxidoreductase n=1 Tax=Neonectria ditissima TaxID=78410 RepID=A0A0P7BG59_9HYPO|nr:hypothetical protein AK830_g4413 [Neonectria ditissima]
MSRYAEAHKDPKGPGDARPTALQVVQDEGLTGKLKGKVAVVTGTSSGIGIETARALATTGATVFLLARNIPKAEEALSEIVEPGRVELVEIDHNSFRSVRSAASVILQKSNGNVNLLVNNAGIMALPNLEATEDGYEKQFGINHLSHFLLFQLLKPALLSASTPEFHSRVVNVSSSAHKVHGINDSDNYNFQKGGYEGWVSYGQSKTALIYMANEIDRRYGPRGLHATSVHPGLIFTGLQKYMSNEQKESLSSNKEVGKQMKSTEQGAATTIVALLGREWENKGGRYLEDCAEAIPAAGTDISGPGYVAYAYDEAKEARLWADSLKIVGERDDSEPL